MGSGAVGSVVAARLSSVSSNVHLVSRKGGGEHLIKNGLTLVSSRGDYYAENLSIVDDNTAPEFSLYHSGKSVPPPKNEILKGVFDIIIGFFF